MRAANPLSPNAPDHVPQRAALFLPSPDPPGRGVSPAGKPPQRGATAPSEQASQGPPDALQAIALGGGVGHCARPRPAQILSRPPQQDSGDCPEGRADELTWPPAPRKGRASNKGGPRIHRARAADVMEIRDEAHISALEPGSRPSPRVPRPHGHQGRPSCSGSPPRQGPEKAVGLNRPARAF